MFPYDRFPLYLSSFCFFVPFRQNGRLFVFLRNIHSSIEILKIKILEYSYPPSQHFFVTKAFCRLFLSRRKAALCQSGRMAQYLFYSFSVFVSLFVFCSFFRLPSYPLTRYQEVFSSFLKKLSRCNRKVYTLPLNRTTGTLEWACSSELCQVGSTP